MGLLEKKDCLTLIKGDEDGEGNIVIHNDEACQNK